ncbi:MAG: methylenetetrahydrofolate dehydrogenase / methenyltetrahydrofolate cyclohydrolase [Epulopiscium sp.]|jgi:methylenetetrahydrofolate dehydrogenase (NADP+)/methenyltetrahydrofolate cyclohydrolase|uniref:Bifunctional protein FolD n=1 Tax=Defluviitalea raffinosedens TaxID=1450156 RepID=A0A7C8HG94_9FIRM|nr:bifunctional methylenetetrahydrofolate dehydrogenase/methenyltetrahydrofolate cyclohydrolase FolD [Defluviitalea raffinosedens]KAE9637095.1 bifunctional methylenetetrahydrofolate dehydrogenase/methenyltetrahydrofolate cyclohydrolase FolD [Defluviitalea raffinosedens]MBM7685146.1 methylenetetrahydrofolate dehydrogenase (NADP+)/methenyltetrahydrofolate cyclohydrolase [Defluviitalea raffinosedens]MDK2789143.1 methylenetetrahydrofolate dehydrogenase / methenyltetrahydrofolate cyclohydrolase [Cand
MSTLIIDGKKISQDIKDELKKEVEELSQKNIIPGLAVILVGNDPASKVYVNNKKKACEYIGIKSFSYELPQETTEEELLNLIDVLNKTKEVNGILVQLPLPEHINESKILLSIDPIKDVDCFHPYNVGLISIGKMDGFLPCTPAGIIELIKRSNIEIEGKNCVVVGRSNIVGKPVSQLLLSHNGTVTTCHSRTKELAKICQEADLLVAAIGRPQFIKADMVKEGSILIDVGVNRLDNGKLCGDIDFEGCKDKALAITPVPGGVGPMTIAMLMKNCVKAALMQN